MDTPVFLGVGLLFLVLFGYLQATPKVYIIQTAPTGSTESRETRDSRNSRPPRPQRYWDNGPEVPARGFLDPVPTRGEPESYQQMGLLEASDGKLLPLYGRRTDPRSDRFNYYTRTDTYNPVTLPVSYKRKDCQDNLGCDEMMNGDTVRLAPSGQSAKVTLYGFDGPRYSSSTA